MRRFTLLDMREGVTTAVVVKAIAHANVEGAAELLRAGGRCPPPTVQMLSRHTATRSASQPT